MCDDWARVAESSLAWWGSFSADEQTQLADIADWLLRHKHWEAANHYELNDEIVTISTPEKFSLLDFEQLSDSISMTKQMLDATADDIGALDALNREMGNLELLPGSRS